MEEIIKTNWLDDGTNASLLALTDVTRSFVSKKFLITSFGLYLVPLFAVPILTYQSVLTVAAITHDAPCFVACCIFCRFEINCQYFPRSATCSVALKLRKELTFESNSSFQKCVSNYYGNKHMYFTSIY